MSITDELRKEARGFGRYVYTAPQADCLTASARPCSTRWASRRNRGAGEPWVCRAAPPTERSGGWPPRDIKRQR